MYFSKNKPIPLVYWNVPNFGDILSPYIVGRLSHQEISHKECYRGMRYVCLETLKRMVGYIRKPFDSINYPFQHNLLGVGSIIGWGNGSSIVWGSGFMNSSDSYKGEMKVLAVRGKHTDLKLQSMGYEGCGVYGDPALLLPLLIKAEPTKDNLLGVVPHITETDYFIKNYSDRVKVIDLRTRDIEQVVKDITSCKYILSTSLHGIITAHAYNIPALWIKKHFINTDGFKFKDYFSSVNIMEYEGFTDIDIILNDTNKCKELFDNNSSMALPNVDLNVLRNKLLEVAPFQVNL